MDIKKFVLLYYKGAAKDFYISRIKNPTEALKLHTHSYFQIYYSNSGKMTHFLDNGSVLLAHGDVFMCGRKSYAVSGRVGYYDFSTFYRNLLKNTGLSHMEYRRRKNGQAE